MPTLRELRRRKMLTQRELAELVGVKYQTIQTWEAAQNEPRPQAMRKLVAALGISADELFAALEATRAEAGARNGEVLDPT